MNLLGKAHEYLVFKFKSLLGVYQVMDEMWKLSEISIQGLLTRDLYENPKCQDKGRLNKYEFQVYSQSGEDGIIQEIFRRIGTTNKTFVKFGAGSGL